MSKLQINRQGFYPIINKEQEAVSIYRIGKAAFRLELPPNSIVDTYLGDIKLYSTTDSIIDLSDIDFSELVDNQISIKINKKILGYSLKPVAITIPLDVSLWSEDDDFLITCSDEIYCL